LVIRIDADLGFLKLVDGVADPVAGLDAIFMMYAFFLSRICEYAAWPHRS
jgi:hydrogenase/urease accessory protein HupE